MTRNIAPTYTAHFALFTRGRGYSLLASAPHFLIAGDIHIYFFNAWPFCRSYVLPYILLASMPRCLLSLSYGGAFLLASIMFITSITFNAGLYGHVQQSRRAFTSRLKSLCVITRFITAAGLSLGFSPSQRGTFAPSYETHTSGAGVPSLPRTVRTCYKLPAMFSITSLRAETCFHAAAVLHFL